MIQAMSQRDLRRSCLPSILLVNLPQNKKRSSLISLKRFILHQSKNAEYVFNQVIKMTFWTTHASAKDQWLMSMRNAWSAG